MQTSPRGSGALRVVYQTIPQTHRISYMVGL
jgi:hypothetical protein